MPTIKLQVDSYVNRGFLAHAMGAAQHQPMGNAIWAAIGPELKRRGKTQEWLAGEIGVSINAVSKWKNTGQISRTHAVAVSQKLGISLDKLLLSKQHVIAELFEALPEQFQKEHLDHLEFILHRGQNVFGSDRAASYVKMIEKLKADLERRRGGG